MKRNSKDETLIWIAAGVLFGFGFTTGLTLAGVMTAVGWWW